MLRNKEVIQAFLDVKGACNRSMSIQSTGLKLYSYQTCIAQHLEDGSLIVNVTKYTTTTSHHQGILRKLLDKSQPIYYVDNIPINTGNLLQYANITKDKASFTGGIHLFKQEVL